MTRRPRGADNQNARIEFGGVPVVVARIDQLDVPGFVIYVDAQQEDEVTRAAAAAGALRATPKTLEAARIEAGYPIFGVDMTADTIPLEAGIEDRAISLTKGCYVGQEVIIRVLHRGHGRVARKLVGLHVEGDVPPRRREDLQRRSRDRLHHERGEITAARGDRAGLCSSGFHRARHRGGRRPRTCACARRGHAVRQHPDQLVIGRRKEAATDSSVRATHSISWPIIGFGVPSRSQR